ncbi:MAG: dihydrofolate synthase / folylpolyglutamate synthase [Candidatus Berkelbacteria bacterium Gr01-1014_85]|uniref:tetrahydrofolate synthase n=1 Tax=Candidatus Berkelbacteria bacterium Gr01-1014_85 TaxID=2017150 RepID=A0A554JCR5_9BACT|nr:MAG: dihydrofolate synthase / folylpolyglutamate synthase [Candidatus Berkelbacteria bacterium Gr01-1014_85]
MSANPNRYQQALSLLRQSQQRGLLSPIYHRLRRLELLAHKLQVDLQAPTVHIAGTSGKGSTSLLVSQILMSAGYKVGLHTTPHLQTVRERMQIDGQLITEDQFSQRFEHVYQQALQIEAKSSYGAFQRQELLFMTALLHFQTENVDIAVIETFMGGEYDPTNIIKPLVSCVTNVDLDHTRLLGKDLISIAMVKAGVIKPQVPFVNGAIQPAVSELFARRAEDLGSPYIEIGQKHPRSAKSLGLNGSLLTAEVMNQFFYDLHLSLIGQHQIQNALMSLYLIQVLRSRGWLIADLAIRQGLKQAFIPGRLEIVDHSPLTILDGAHNPAKCTALAQSMRILFPKKRIIMVFAMKKGKDLLPSLKPLTKIVDKIIVTRFSERKGYATTDLAKLVRQNGIPCTTRLDPTKAYELAKDLAGHDGIVLITGSLYLVGLLRCLWHPVAYDGTLQEDHGKLIFQPGEPQALTDRLSWEKEQRG